MIENELNSLFTKAESSLGPSSFPSAANVRNAVKELGTANSSVYYELVDMTHLSRLMSKNYPAESRGLSDALNEFVVYHRASIPNVGGVSLFFPYKDKAVVNEMASLYRTFNFADDYTKYMQKCIALLQDDPEIDWNMSGAKTERGSESKYSIQLTPEQVETFARASFLVLMEYVDDAGDYSGY